MDCQAIKKNIPKLSIGNFTVQPQTGVIPVKI
jgi:hypothetical protein